MAREEYDLIVIGAGPGGYVAALRASQLGWKVACVEKESALGGTCLRVGCIPSKALLESSERFVETRDQLEAHGILAEKVEIDLAALLDRKDRIVEGLTKGVEGLFRKNRVERRTGRARIAGPGRVAIDSSAGSEVVEAKNILIATGSRSAPLPGIETDGDRIGTSTDALSYSSPPEHLVVIGAGYIGLELGSVWNRLGSRVTVLEYLDRILPGIDLEIAREARRLLEKQGLELLLESKVAGAVREGERVRIEVEGRDSILADRVLLSVGRLPYTDGLGLEKIGVRRNDKGFILVDESYRTSVPGVFAIGDVIPGPMLAHKAEEEGIACVERMINGYGHVNYEVIPAVVYTSPEIAAVGRTEEQLREEGVPFKKGSFPFAANGRARSLGHTEGRVKILAHAETDRVLGVHIIGPRAGDLIAEAAAAMEFGASSEDIARTCHAHPTLAEVVKEAALAVDERALHI